MTAQTIVQPPIVLKPGSGCLCKTCYHLHCCERGMHTNMVLQLFVINDSVELHPGGFGTDFTETCGRFTLLTRSRPA